MKTFYIILVVGLFAGRLFGQAGQTISGTVRYMDGGAIPRVPIVLTDKSGKEKARTATTDSKGEFSFPNIPDGSYLLTASFGNLDRKERDVIVAGGDVAGITLVAAFAGGLSESVTISADTEQTLDQVSKTVNVIGGQEMRDRADFTLVDAVRTIPGFRVQQLGGFGRTASIKSRGLRNQDTAVLIDGLRFRDPGSITGDATPFLSDFTLTSVSRIEVLRGSGSSLYGTNAIGGTLDFQTPRPEPGIHGQVSGAAGGLGLGRFRGNLSYGTGDRRFGINGAFSRTAYTKGIDGEDNAGNTSYQSRAEFNPFHKTNVSARFFITDANVRLNSSPETLGALPPVTTVLDAQPGVNFAADVNDPDSIQRSRFFIGQVAVNHVVNDRLRLTGSYNGLVTKRTNHDGPFGVGFQSAFSNSFGGTIHTANINATWSPSSSNTLTGGYEFEAERFRNDGSTPSGTDDFWTRAGQRSNTLYAQHLISLMNGDLQIAGGARAQWFALEQPEFSVTTGPYLDLTLSDPPAAYTFDGSASYFVSRTGTKLRTHVGSGYRVPSLYERFGTFFFFGQFFPQGNPSLRPERSIGIDAGLDQYFAGEKVKASATYFYTRIKDEITYLPTDDFGAPVYYNFDRHYSRGVELSADINPTRSTDIFASYTFTNSDVRNFRRPGIASLAATDAKSFGIPDHQFTFVVTQRIKRFWVSADLLATSSYLAPVFNNLTFERYTYRFGGNRRADVTAGYTFPLHSDKLNLRLFGTIENVLDYDYYENGFRTAGRNARAGLSLAF